MEPGNRSTPVPLHFTFTGSTARRLCGDTEGTPGALRASWLASWPPRGLCLRLLAMGRYKSCRFLSKVWNCTSDLFALLKFILLMFNEAAISFHFFFSNWVNDIRRETAVCFWRSRGSPVGWGWGCIFSAPRSRGSPLLERGEPA